MQRLKEFGAYIQTTFQDEKLVDGEGLWEARSGDSKEFALLPDEPINTVLLQEEITKGQRVEAFGVEGLVDGEWVLLTEGTTIGYKRLLRFSDLSPTRLRVNITSTRDVANIAKVGAYHAPNLDN